MGKTYEEAKTAWLVFRADNPPEAEGPIAELDEYFGLPRRNMPPDKWRVGDRVRYVKSSEWTWCRDTVGVITELAEGYEDRAPNEYQVFWVSPLKGSGSWWTTPSDVEFVERPL